MDVSIRAKRSNYPEHFFTRVTRRKKRPLETYFGLNNSGVNLTELEPGDEAVLMHSHGEQDEMICGSAGDNPTLATEFGETAFNPGVALVSVQEVTRPRGVERTDRMAVLLEIGDLTRGD